MRAQLSFFAVAIAVFFASPVPAKDPPAGASARAVVINANEATAATSAYGFCVAQKLSLEEVAKLYPDLAAEALLVEREFHRNTGDACQDIEAAVKAFFDEHKAGAWVKLKAEMADRLNKELRPQFIQGLSTKVAAKQFLSTVRARGMGDIPEVVAQPLINASQQFRAYPSSQWKHWTKVWRLSSTASTGDIFHVKVPVSYEEKTPSAAHMIRKWTQRVGIDGTHVMLSVSRFSYEDGENQSQAEQEFGSSDPTEFAREYASSAQGEVLDAKRVKVMSHPAVVVTTRMKLDSLSISTETTQRQLFVAGVSGIAVVSCATTSNETKQSADDQLFERIVPLCELFMSSFGWN